MNRFEAGMTIGINETKWVAGFKISTEGKDPTPKKKSTNSTAKHEAMHVVAAINNGTSVESVTIVPGPGYSGLTELSRPDPVAALAPHANGADGTSYDVYIAGLMGHSPESLGGVARGIIGAHQDEVEAVAVALEEERTLGNGGINRAIEEYKRPKFETAKVSIQNSEGGRVEISKAEVRDNIVMVPEVWYSLAEKKIQSPLKFHKIQKFFKI